MLKAASDERKKLLSKISVLYYIKGLTQQEITRKLGISRPMISRMLSEARETGIVKITIQYSYGEECRYDELINEKYGLVSTRVANTIGYSSPIEDVGMAAADLLMELIQNNEVIGVGAGTTLTHIVPYLHKTDKKNIVVVPLTGGWGSAGTEWQANLNVTSLANGFACRYSQLNAPAFVSTKETRDALFQEHEIASVLQAAKKASIALVGVGQFSREATIITSGFLSDSNILELEKKGAVASFSNSFLDKNGNIIHYSAFDRMIGLAAEDMKKIPTVIVCAAGIHKVPAIQAVLKGKWCNYLVTDHKTMEVLLNE